MALRPPVGIFQLSKVLLKDIPDSLKESVRAYIGCLSGAIKKDDYLGQLRSAGFQQVDVVQSAEFSVDSALDGGTVNAIKESLNLTDEDVKGFKHTVISIQVQGTKPRK